MPSDLKTLIDACLAGDQFALARFVQYFQGPVFGLCWRMLRHRQDAEDVAQESLVRALRHLSRWDPTRPLEPWLLAIAANRCRTHLAKRRVPQVATEFSADWCEDSSGEHENADHLREELELALQEIRPHWEHAFRLFHEHELSYVQISEELRVPVGTAKTWVHRARREIVGKLLRREVIFGDRHAVRAG